MGKGKNILIAILIILLIGLGCFTVFQYKNYDELNKKYNDINKKTENTKEITITDEDTLKEGFIKYGKDYKIFGIGAYVSADDIIVSYNGSLYCVYNGEFEYINRLSSISFDSSGDYKDNIGTVIVHKYNGKENDLVKVVYSKSVFSTDGSSYPILIYKDGTVESIDDVEKVLKNYKIKDFLSEECTGRDTNNICNSASYEVVLEDGTTQKVK